MSTEDEEFLQDLVDQGIRRNITYMRNTLVGGFDEVCTSTTEIKEELAKIHTTVDEGLSNLVNTTNIGPSLGAIRKQMEEANEIFFEIAMTKMRTKHDVEYIEQIEKALEQHNKNQQKVTKICEEIAQNGSAEMGDLNKNILDKFRRNYPCCPAHLEDLEPRRTCKCVCRIFSNAVGFSEHLKATFREAIEKKRKLDEEHHDGTTEDELLSFN
jgi:hypothetical protein